MITDLQECSHNPMIPMYRKFNDDTSVRFLITMTNVLIPFIKEYRGPILRSSCDVIDDVITIQDTFWHDLGRSFQI